MSEIIWLSLTRVPFGNRAIHLLRKITIGGKVPIFFSQWVLVNRPFPSEFWKEPDVISDYWENGAAGKKWTTVNSISAGLDRGDVDQASADELSIREKFLYQILVASTKVLERFCCEG
ncbi:hypothetical protein LSM04_007498 [Trypanosoma melophagium]|uniref:uncharacterized protein n=1 Tax=Trypanosoma melophagium TaxID=715481 RepID=UPI00351A739F|nr:hypothetical protein LSM04_007498 [Trypanosoma melophagium]